MSTNMQGKAALVTGARAGIGRATALAFAGHGANVVVSDILDRGGEETVAAIREDGASFVTGHPLVVDGGLVAR